MADIMENDPVLYPIGEEDVEHVTVTGDILAPEEEYEIQNAWLLMADMTGMLDRYTAESVRKKYKAWCDRFKQEPPLATLHPKTIVVIAGLPAVDSNKKEKFLKLANLLAASAFEEKAYLKKTINVKDLKIDLVPESLEEPTEGEPIKYLPIGFIRCPNVETAEHVCEILCGIKIGTKNKFLATTADCVPELREQGPSDVPEKPLSPAPVPKGILNHLKDPMGREMFLVASSEKEAQIMWNDAVLKAPQPYNEGAIACSNAAWTPKGSYLLTLHNKGVRIRGGPNLDCFRQLPCGPVWSHLCSPDERYFLTWDGLSNSEGSHKSAMVHSLLTGTVVHSSWCPPIDRNGGEMGPFFAWSSCSQYLACNDGASIRILCVPSFEPMKNEDGSVYRIPIKNERSTFSWSPTDACIAIWTPPVGTDRNGRGDGPCFLKVINVETRQSVASKPFNVALDKFAGVTWHPQGNHLALRLDVLQKVGKKTRKLVTQIEVFHMTLHGSPSDTIMVPADEGGMFKHCAFEPMGKLFAVLTADHVKIWRLDRDASHKKTQIICSRSVGQVTGPQFDHVYWSPQSNFFVLAGIGITDGNLSFNAIKTDSNGNSKILESHHDSHFSMNSLMWDPSGRYVASAVTVKETDGPVDFAKTSNSGYKIWTFQGKEIASAKSGSNGAFIGFQWRPHPSPVLKPEKVQDVISNVTKYGSKYDTDDDALRTAAISEAESQKQSMLHKFNNELSRASQALATDPMASAWETAWTNYKAKSVVEYINVEHTGKATSEIRIIKPAGA